MGESFDELFVRHTSATLQGYKAGSLFSYRPCCEKVFQKALEALDEAVSKKDVRVCTIDRSSSFKQVFVYRPRMIDAMLSESKFQCFLCHLGYPVNQGSEANIAHMKRDFTYIDDIVQGVVNLIDSPPVSKPPYRLYNIGNNKPVDLMHFIKTLEKCLKGEGLITQPAKMEFLPMQAGDVYQTYADINDLMRDFGFKPSTTIEEGLSHFAAWYKQYYINDVSKGETE